jgi:hypothetical protein
MADWGHQSVHADASAARARLGLSASVVEAVFAMYAIGLVPGAAAGGAVGADRPAAHGDKELF